MVLTFDVECYGLFGEAFAVGYVLTTDMGSPVMSGIHCCDLYVASTAPTDPTPEQTALWLLNHVVPVLPEPDCSSVHGVRKEFGRVVRQAMQSAEHIGEKLLFVADVPFPCETEFLRMCQYVPDDYRFPSPYPLIDVASMLLAKGYDPIGTYMRNDDELPAHNPLCDARQSSRIYHDLMAGRPIHLEAPNVKQ